MRLSTSPRPPEADDYFYPHSDGLPAGETPAHVRNLVLGTDILDAWFAGNPQVFVAGKMFIYYVPRNRRMHVLRMPAEDREVLAQTAAKLNQTAAERDRLAAERDQAMAEKERVEQELAELRRRLVEMSG